MCISRFDTPPASTCRGGLDFTLVSWWRVEAGFSQESLARAAKVHPTYISLIERGLRDPRLTSIAKLAKALKTSPADLMLEAKRGR